MKIIAVEDLRVYPTDLVVESTFAGDAIIPLNEKVLSIGDLHGNAIKLIHTLRLFGVMKLKSSLDYNVLLTIYDKDTDLLTQSDLDRFKNILDEAIIDRPGLLIFIGDEFADRGSNDYFTALVFQTLHDAHVSYRIQLSNHGLIALEYIKTGVKKPLGGIGQTQSLDNLIGLFNRIPATEDIFRNIYDDAYITHLSLIGYTFKDNLTIYAHAPIDIYTIGKLAELFGVEIKWNTNENIIRMIDEINKRALLAINDNSFFLDYIESCSYQECTHLSTDDLCSDFYSFGDRENPDISNPLYELMWNRQYEYDDVSERMLHDRYVFVHGHIGDGNFLAGYINLDTNLGKPKEIAMNRFTGAPLQDNMGLPVIIPADDKGDLITSVTRVDLIDRMGAYLSGAKKPMAVAVAAALGVYGHFSGASIDEVSGAACKKSRLDPLGCA